MTPELTCAPVNSLKNLKNPVGSRIVICPFCATRPLTPPTKVPDTGPPVMNTAPLAPLVPAATSPVTPDARYVGTNPTPDELPTLHSSPVKVASPDTQPITAVVFDNAKTDWGFPTFAVPLTAHVPPET